MLLGQVLNLLLLHVLVLLGTVGLEDTKRIIETLFDGVFNVLEALDLSAALEELVEFIVHVFLVQLIEMETNSRNLVLDVLDI